MYLSRMDSVSTVEEKLLIKNFCIILHSYSCFGGNEFVLILERSLNKTCAGAQYWEITRTIESPRGLEKKKKKKWQIQVEENRERGKEQAETIALRAEVASHAREFPSYTETVWQAEIKKRAKSTGE